jgi:hypothetical protein
MERDAALGGGDVAATGAARYLCGRRGNRAICGCAGAERGFSFKSGEIQWTKISVAIVGIGDDKQLESLFCLGFEFATPAAAVVVSDRPPPP